MIIHPMIYTKITGMTAVKMATSTVTSRITVEST